MSDRIDRYVRDELSPAEARALAQQALDSPALFNELTDSALAKAALNARTVRIRRPTPFPVNRKWLIAMGAAAAILAGFWISPLHRRSAPPQVLKPVLEVSAASGRPVLLASGLEPAGAPRFRGAEPDGRAPRPEGTIASVDGEVATVDLGSLDGLTKGGNLEVWRAGQKVGSLQMTAVFRDHARARTAGGQAPRPNDAVHVDAANHFSALLEQVDAAFNGGDDAGAVRLAEEAVRWGESAGVAPRVLSIGWNQLAALHMLRGEYGGVEQLLGRVTSSSPTSDLIYAESMNNLGVLAEIRGDRKKAEELYSDALRTFQGQPQKAVERNLVRVRGAR
jgi:hypothetical protein